MAVLKKVRAHMSRMLKFAGINAVSGVVLCALLLLFTLGNPVLAFMWASNSTSTDGAVVSVADMKLTLSDVAETELNNFLSTPAAIKAQKDLLDNVDSSGAYFAEWCLDNLLEEDKGYLESAEAACRYSLLRRGYSFKNESTIPVYFRIDRAAVSNDMDIVFAAFWNRGAGTAYHSFYYDEESGCYYYQEPFFVGQEISVIFVALILDADDATRGSFDFRPDFAEVIQATNNAVFMVEGWKNAAVEFTSYYGITDPVLGGGGDGGDIGDIRGEDGDDQGEDGDTDDDGEDGDTGGGGQGEDGDAGNGQGGNGQGGNGQTPNDTEINIL